MSRGLLLVLTAAIAALLAPGFAERSAVAADEARATVLELTSMPAQDERGKPLEGKYWISVMLTTEDGRYVANRAISVTEPIDFFGPREAKLGTTETDATGFAAVPYQPSQPGKHTIVARFRGDEQYMASKTEVVVDVADVVAPFAAEPLPLAAVGDGLAVFLGVLGIAFWVVLLGVLGRTAWGIKAASRRVAGPIPAVRSRAQEVLI